MNTDEHKLIFIPNGRLGNAIFRYIAAALVNIFNPTLTYCLSEDFVEPVEKITYYPGLDHEGDDIRDHNISRAVAYNTLGYYKHIVDIDKLKSNIYINKENGHGIYIKNTISITDNNFFRFIDKKLEYFNIYMDGYFQFGHIYLTHKQAILNYMEEHKNIHYIQTDRNDKFLMRDIFDDMYLMLDKQYDVVIHIRLGDFYGRPDFIEKQYYIDLFKHINFANKRICLLCDKLTTTEDYVFIGACSNWFADQNITVYLETNDILTDFNIMKQAKTLVCSMSTLSWAAAYLSKSIQQCYMPNYNFYNNTSRRNFFFKKPTENTILYPVKTTVSSIASIKPVILTLPEYTSRLSKLDHLMQKLSSIGLDTEVHNGVNGKNITIKPSIYDHYKFITYKNKMYLYNSTIRLNGAKMTRGEFGCAWSHLELLKRLVEEPTTSASTPISYYLILEDDVELVKPPDELYKLLQHIPDDTDMCHLAKSDWYPFEKTNQINPYFYECKKNFFNKTTAYLVSKKGAAKIVAYIENSINVPIDDLYNMIYRLTPDFRFYVPFEYFFKEQDNITSTIHDINNQSC